MQIKMKTCFVYELPNCLKTAVLNHLKNKTSDCVSTLRWRGYIVDCWSISDPVQYSTDYYLRGCKK